MVIVFHNTLQPGTLDRTALHAGAPLLAGEKWNANQWVSNRRVPFARRVALPTLLLPWGGDPPPAFLKLRNWYVADVSNSKVISITVAALKDAVGYQQQYT
eukprot:15892-Heterococcus_DN1.PRE.1